MTSSKLINYTTREFMSENELELYATKQDEIFTPKVIDEFKKAGMLRRVLTRIWNKIMLSKDLKNGDKKKVNFNNQEVLLVRNNNNLSAFSNLCPHMNLPLEMGQITPDNEFLCPFHVSKFCLKTGAVKKWVLTIAEWVPDEAKELAKAIKEIPLDLLPIMDKDDHIWLGLN